MHQWQWNRMTVNRISSNKSFMILCLDKSLYTFQICWQNYRAFRFNKQSNENTERKNIASFSTNFSLRVKLYQTRANWCNFFSFMLVSKISGICFTTCEDKNIESSSKISQPLCHNHNQECIEGRFILSCHSFTKGWNIKVVSRILAKLWRLIKKYCKSIRKHGSLKTDLFFQVHLSSLWPALNICLS